MVSRRTFVSLPCALPFALAAGKLRAGCQTRAFGSPIRDKTKLLAALDDIAATGYEGFETNFASLEHSFDNPRPMREEFARRKLELIALHASPKLMSMDGVEKELAQALRIAKAVRDFGGSILVVSGPGVPRDAAGKLDIGALDRWTGNLNLLGARTREYGIRLAVHNHAKELMNNAEELDGVLRATDGKNVGLLVDVSYFVGSPIAVGDFIRHHASRIAGLHLRDLRDGAEVDLGDGGLDLKGLSAAIQATGMQGWAILELNQRRGLSSREMISLNRSAMRKHLGI